MDVLRWARDRGCDWDASTCGNAAEGGHLEVLKWAWEHGCPWVSRAFHAWVDCCNLAAPPTWTCCCGWGERLPVEFAVLCARRR